MLEAWQGIDPNIAEARLRGLRRRLSELDAALMGQQSLARTHPNSFAIALSGESLRSMEFALRQELVEVLRHRHAEHLSLVLDGPNYSQHSAKLADLGLIFTRMQKLFSSIAQAISTGPTTRGPIRTEIMAKTAMQLHATYASSFGMKIAVLSEYDLLGDSLSSDTLVQMFQLLAASHNDSRLMRISGEIGRRSLVHLRHLATHLRATETELNVEWKDFAGTKYEWQISRNIADEIIKSIDNITETRSETKVFDGWLVGASLLRNRFELLVDFDEVIEGKFVNGLTLDIQKSFGKRISTTVDETEVHDRSTGESKKFYTLKSLQALDY